MSPLNYSLIDNTIDNQFEFHIENQIAFSKYAKKDGVIYLTHVEVPKALENRGIASALMKQSLEHIEKENKYKVQPVCSFAVTYFQRHPAWQKLLA